MQTYLHTVSWVFKSLPTPELNMRVRYQALTRARGGCLRGLSLSLRRMALGTSYQGRPRGFCLIHTGRGFWIRSCPDA